MDTSLGVVHEVRRWLLPLRVQRLRLPEGGRRSFTVVGADALPVAPIEQFLVHLSVAGKSPNTVEGYARDLRDFFVWLDQTGHDFRRLRLEQVSEFFVWLRRPPETRRPGVFVLPGTPSAVASTTLVRKRAAVASFYRFHARRDDTVPALLGELVGRRPTGGYVPMLAHTRRGRVDADAYSPIRLHTHRKPPRTMTVEQEGALLAACRRLRDRFLLGVLVGAGLRLGEALGLRHADLHLRAGEVHVVPREDNVNDARVKGLKPRIVPIGADVFDLYAEYMEVEYGSLDSDYVLSGHPDNTNCLDLDVIWRARRIRWTAGQSVLVPSGCFPRSTAVMGLGVAPSHG